MEKTEAKPNSRGVREKKEEEEEETTTLAPVLVREKVPVVVLLRPLAKKSSACSHVIQSMGVGTGMAQAVSKDGAQKNAWEKKATIRHLSIPAPYFGRRVLGAMQSVKPAWQQSLRSSQASRTPWFKSCSVVFTLLSTDTKQRLCKPVKTMNHDPARRVSAWVSLVSPSEVNFEND